MKCTSTVSWKQRSIPNNDRRLYRHQSPKSRRRAEGKSGMQLGRYEIIEPIGRGASSTVFKARDALIGRIVAIKTLQSDLDDPAWRERFTAEARIVGHLSHPRFGKLHAVPIHQTSGSPYRLTKLVLL